MPDGATTQQVLISMSTTITGPGEEASVGAHLGYGTAGAGAAAGAGATHITAAAGAGVLAGAGATHITAAAGAGATHITAPAGAGATHIMAIEITRTIQEDVDITTRTRLVVTMEVPLLEAGQIPPEVGLLHDMRRTVQGRELAEVQRHEALETT